MALALRHRRFGHHGRVDATGRGVSLVAFGLGTLVAPFAAANFDHVMTGTLGFAAATAYLRDLVHVRRFLAAGIPLALSIAWRQGDLPAAPLPASAGHLVIVRGFTEHGAVLINDPAQPCVCVDYSREAFERAWLGHGGVAYLVAPRGRAGDLTALANS